MVTRKEVEKFLKKYYTQENKPKGISKINIIERIELSTFADLLDDYRLIKKLKKSKTLKKK